MTTRETIETYYASVNRGDWDTWLTLFTDGVVIDEQLAGHVEGLDILRGAIAQAIVSSQSQAHDASGERDARFESPNNGAGAEPTATRPSSSSSA